MSDRVQSQAELDGDREWMAAFLARERKQVQEEQALKDRQREEMRRWKDALDSASRAEELVRSRPLSLLSRQCLLRHVDHNVAERYFGVRYRRSYVAILG